MVTFPSLSLARLESLYADPELPSAGELKSSLKKAIKTLKSESPAYRPVTRAGNPGSLLQFSDNLPTIIIPDLHARSGFLLAVLRMTLSSFVLPPAAHSSDQPVPRITVFEALQQKRLRVVCLGDALHAEARQRDRWIRAYGYYLQGQKINIPMVEEMHEGLSLIRMICVLKNAFPEHFHFLKGNHENITNTDSNGNHPFKKFAAEGEMVCDFMKRVYGNGTLQLYDSFEKMLPLFVQTPWFLASHAEPVRVYTKDEIINAYLEHDVISGLTWTPNDAADPENVPSMLRTLVPDNPDALWFGGHRPVPDARYNLRAGGKYVQLHNPSATNVALVPGERSAFDFDAGIIDVSAWSPADGEVT